MAITVAQAVNYLVEAIKTSPLASGEGSVSGGVYPFQRPLNSTREDVVVNSLAMGREAVQEGMLNVNVYVPNRQYAGATTTDSTRPDMERLAVLNGIGSDFLEDSWNEAGTVNYELQQDSIQKDGNAQHYVNFRVIFRALNIN